MATAADLGPRFWDHLHDRRFWMVQALVLTVAAVHIIIEMMDTLHGSGDLYLLPVSLFVVPVLYASLNFGLEGALATGLWCTLLTTHHILQFPTLGEQVAIFMQLAFLVLLGTIVAIRVDKERRAKLAAEQANRRLGETQASLKEFIALAFRAGEAERFRLSRELHDESVQELVVAKTALEDVVVSPDQRARLELVNAAVQRCIVGIRRMCQALRPSVLDDLGLVPALDWLLSDLAGRTGIQIALETQGDPLVLDLEQELVIFRVAQQALQNVERHARASRVLVRLADASERLCLEVVDNGCGFDPAHARKGGLGLAGMQERASLIGAQLEISSRPGKTSIRLDLRPLPNRRPTTGYPRRTSQRTPALS